MSINTLIDHLNSNPKNVSFQEVIDAIDSSYFFKETRFSNGNLINEEGENNGSCKIVFFAKINKLSKDQTLHCFGDYYRIDVLGNPDGSDHQNIRNFMQHGWEGVSFSGQALLIK